MKNILFYALTAAALLFMPKVVFGQAPNLGTAANFVLFTTVGAVTNSGIPYLTHLTGNVGSNSGSSTGFGNVDGRMLDGGIESAAAATDLGIAYLELDGAIPTFFPSSLLGGGATLVPGVYSIPSAATMNGILNLDAGGDPNAIFIFQIEGAFATGSGTKVHLLNGALACNVFWKVEGMVSLASGTTMRGTIVAHNDAISIGVGDTLEGRALSINGAITTNGILAYTPIGCGSPVLTGAAAPPLGAAAIFGVFSSIGSVTATPITYVNGDVGSNSAGATGFDPLNVTGTIHPAPDAATGAAAADLTIAYNFLNATTTDINLLYPALFGNDLVLTPHVYNLAGAPTTLTGSVFLNAQGNPNAVFIIKMSGAFITSTLSRIVLINGAKAENVYWKIDGAVNIFANSFFNGNIVGAGAITLNTGDTLNGRALTINGAVAINGSYIEPNPGPCQASEITGTMQVCVGGTTLLSNVDTGGMWYSTDTAVATVDTASGLVTGVSAGTVIISFRSGLYCEATDTVLVNAAPASITGSDTVCTGDTVMLSNITTGGTWTSSDTAIATVAATSGVVTGIAAGQATISYTTTGACSSFMTINVSPTPFAGIITGISPLCPTDTATMYSDTTGGFWFSGNTSVASIDSVTGLVAALISGTTVISYTVTNSCGVAAATSVVTVSALPSAGIISGTATVCPASTTTLTSTVSGGRWASSSTTIASVDSLSGVVTGVIAGTTTISYTVTNSCGTAAATQVVTVNPLPNAGTVSGTALICSGSTTTLSSTATGGVWSSTNTAVATVGTSGVVSGITAGTSTISYTATNSCGTVVSSVVVTVSPLPVAGPITGVLVVCTSATTTLGNSTTGGVWTSSNISVASIGSSSGIATGVTTGTVAISYTVTNSCGSAAVGAVLTVNPVPVAGTITGLASICPASTSTLSSTVAGGEWTSSNTTVATVGSVSGVVTGLILGTSTISYTVSNSCGEATTTVVVTVDVVPNAGTITGITTLCPAATTTLSNVVSGGVWSSVTTSVATIGATSGIVSGVAAGTSLMSYTVANSCGTAAATIIVTVSPLPDAGSNTGTATVCPAATITLSNAVSGGTWSSTNTAVATVGSASGIVSGVAPGTSVVSYTVINSCGTAAATTVVTVSTLPDAGTVTGIAIICATGTINFSSTVSGGVWSSANPTVASVGSATGLVVGLVAGTSTIIYTVTNSCGAASDSRVVTVNPSPVAGTISGATSVCVGAAITLASTEFGGVWSSSSANATVTSSGVVTGITSGSSVITYSVTNSCGTDFDTHLVAVNPLPNAGVISGPSAVCVGGVIILTNTAATGTWSSNSTANVSGGMVIGVLPGIDTIIYSVSNVCGSASVIKIITVNVLPLMPVITTQSPAALCVGTMYQNFGTSVLVATGTEYNWTAVNAGVWAQGAFSNYALVNFNVIDTAFVTLTATISTTGCSSAATTAVNVGASPAHTDYVSYFNMHFVCTPADNSTYQWGYDDAFTLDSVLLKGEINQDYVNTNPDLSNKYYWVMTTRNGCMQKTYYRAPVTVQTINEEAVTVTVFPNPASGIVNISISNVAPGEIVVEISNILGQKIAATTAIAGKATLDVATMPAGAYLVACFHNGVRIAASRITKN